MLRESLSTYFVVGVIERYSVRLITLLNLAQFGHAQSEHSIKHFAPCGRQLFVAI